MWCWWNTALSPMGRARKYTEQEINTNREMVSFYLDYYIRELNTSFLALGEVSENDVRFLSDRFDKTPFEVVNGVAQAGKRAKFSNCFVYNSNKLQLIDYKEITTSLGDSNTLKVAQKLMFCSKENEPELFNIFISHWPSLLNVEKNASERHLLSMRLRDKVDEVLTEYDVASHIILMGDYNEEPYSQAIHEQLRASRDILIVKANEKTLYNPMWKQMSNMSWDEECAGSYYYKSGKLTKWTSIDQVIISKSLCESDSWAYNHGKECIINVPGLVELIKSRKTDFDHLPVFCFLEKEKVNG